MGIFIFYSDLLSHREESAYRPRPANFVWILVEGFLGTRAGSAPFQALMDTDWRSEKMGKNFPLARIFKFCDVEDEKWCFPRTQRLYFCT